MLLPIVAQSCLNQASGSTVGFVKGSLSQDSLMPDGEQLPSHDVQRLHCLFLDGLITLGFNGEGQ
jgi:hypothetical protein